MKNQKTAEPGNRFLSIFAAGAVMSFAGGAYAISVGPVQVPEPFASFQNGNFHFTNLGLSGELFSDANPQLTPTFIFYENVSYNNPGNGLHSYGANQPVTNVTMTLTAPTSAGVTGSPASIQPLSGGTWTFLDQFGDNLLTISNFTGNLLGIVGGSTENLTIDTTKASPDTLTYTSDFLTFNPNTVGIDSTGLTLDNASKVSVNVSTVSILNDFTANGDGTFSAVVVPEPATLSLAAMAGFMLLGRRSRRA